MALFLKLTPCPPLFEGKRGGEDEESSYLKNNCI
jgi:hypothetical protein